MKSSMIATVYHALLTMTSPLSETSLTWETTPNQSNSSEIDKGTNVRHDNQDPYSALLPAPYSIPPFLCARIFSQFRGAD